MEETRNTYNTVTGKPEGKRLPGRPRHRWDNNIKINYIYCVSDSNLIHMTLYRKAITIMNLQVAYKRGIC
jgi:hypothetical protein